MSKSRLLMNGNLVCLSLYDNFCDPIWAIVSIRHGESLKKLGIIFVELLSEHNHEPTYDIIMKLLAFRNKQVKKKFKWQLFSQE